MNNFFKNQMNYDGRTTAERQSNDGQSKGRYSVGLTKLLFTLSLLLTLGVGEMWGIGFNKGNVIFRAQGWNNPSYVYLCIGKSDYTSVYQMSRIGSTDLYHVWVNVDNNDNNWWNGCTYFAVIGSSSSVSSGSWGNSSLSSKGNKGYTAAYTSSYDINNSDGCYFFNKANSTVNGGSFTISYTSFGSIQKYNAIQNAKKRDSGSSYSNVSGTFPAPIKLQGEHLTSNGTSGRNTITRTSSSQGTDYSTYSAVVTGTITHSIDEENLSSDYYLEGWGTSTSPSVTTATYEYKITANTTVYAFFSHLYTLTFLPKGTYGTSTVTASVTDYTDVSSGDKIPTGHSITITATPATGYEIEGWYSDASCNTSLNNGTNTTYTISSLNANGGVYVKFQKKTYSITLDDNGDYQGNGSATVQRGDASLTVSSHASRTSWNLVGYWTASGNGGSQVTDAAGNLIASVSGFTDGSGNWIKDANVSLYAHWNQINSLTVVAGSNISSVTGSTSPVTLGTKYDITATVPSGYSFNGWTADPAANGAFDNASSASTKVQVNNGSVTVTAAATEIMRSITIVGGTVYGGAATSTTAGVATSAKITANAPAEGKKFTGWSLGTGVSLKGGYALTDQTIEIYSTADATVTANYADRAQVKMYFAKPTSLGWSKVYAYAWKSSDGSVHNKDYPGVELENTEVINCVTYYTYQYYTEGDGIGGAATGNSAWNRIVFGDNNDARKTGDLTISNGHYYYKTSTGTGKAAAITSAWGVKTSKDSFAGMNYITHNCATNSGTVDISFTGGNNYNFKLYNEVNDQWWSNSTAMGSSSPVTASMAAAETMYSDDANNMQLNAALTGSYTFTVGSTNASNPTLKVTFPEIYAIVGSFNSWNTETNPLAMVGNTGTANIVLSPSDTNYELKVVDDGAMYGKNSTTITGSTTVSSMAVGQSNIALKADIYPASANPSYGFSYNKSTKALTVTYPSAHTVTYGVGTHAGTTSVTSSISVASGKKILDSQSITFSKGDTKTGYTWKGWYNNNSGSSSALGTGETYTSSSRAANTSVYACYDLVNYTITYNLNGGTNPGGAPTSFTIESSAITLPTPTKTGYTFNGWYENADLSTGGVKTTIPAGSTGNKVYYAKWTPITYTIHFNGNGNTSGSMSNQTGVTYDAATTITANAFVKTGYNFAGWATTQERANAGTIDRTDGAAHGNLASTQGATAQLWAVWTPKQSAITFDYQLSTEGHGNAGTLSSVTATYDAAMPALTGNMPTAANGYAFMGFYDATGGGGTKYYNANGSSAATWDKDTEDGTTLYAYYKKAEITVALDANIFSPVAAGDEGYVVANPTIAPEPVGSKIICWTLLYDNDNPVVGHEAAAYTEGGTKPNQVHFSIAGLAAGGYKVRATLRTGTSCGGGTELDTYDAPFTIASDFTVTVQYKCGDDIIKASTTADGKPTSWTEITAPNVIGYTFVKWKAGEGITIDGADGNGEKASVTIQFKASFNGTLTAIYTKKNVLYFCNTLGWEHVYVYFYNNGNYWNSEHNTSGSTDENVYGSGAQTGKYSSCYTGHYKEMTRIEGTNVFYCDYLAESWSHTNYVTFTKDNQNTYEWFDNTEVVRLADAAHYYDKPGTLPMYVPLNNVYENRNKHGANITKYYTEGYWMNYPENTGYWLKIFDKVGDGAVCLQDIPFLFTGNHAMPMSLTVELNASTTYGYKIYRNDGSWYGNNGTMKIDHSGDFDRSETVWEFKTGKNNCGLKTSVAGDYTFTLMYGLDAEATPAYNYLVGVHYPIGTGSYRIVYNDRVDWSQGSAHSATWWHPSRSIYKEDGAIDTVSFYVSKADGASASMKFQYASAISNEGVVTWTDVTSGSIDLSSITESGVYNFITSQTASAISVSKIEPYTGNYYIRCGALNSKWINYRSDKDHLMTYSSFSEDRDLNTFGELYSHYKAKWCPRGVNVMFCIANDYSLSISDTLIQDVDNPFDNIYLNDGWGRPDGELKAVSYDGSGNPTTSETGDRYSANIRFMWNQHTNKISRAYIGSSTNKERKFLVLRANRTIWGDDESPISEGFTNGVILQDKENWMYEDILYITPSTRFKLMACYARETPDQEHAQYFRGNWETGDAFTSDANSVELIGGSGEKQKARIIYDFKTNRLMAAWIPSNAAVSGNVEINADVLVEREHQEPAQYITFANSDSKLSKVKTVYGAMKFNRWILNNRSNSADEDPNHAKTAEQIATWHAPLGVGQQKSIYERALYFISFPFDVNLSEVFGFGTYGVHWIIEYYDGLNRAKNGYWKDSEPNWKYVMSPNDYVLKANEGYILALDLDQLQADNFSFWSNGISTVELFFPSTTNLETLQQTEVTIEGLGSDYECTINRGDGTEGDRRVKDSYWRCLGVPSFNVYGEALKDSENHTIEWQTNYSWDVNPNTLPFIYMWNKTDNTLTAQSTSAFTFLPMHAYLVQAKTSITWTNASAKPTSIVARQAEEAPAEYNWCLTLNENETLIDRTYIRMTNLEQVTDAFDFGQDLVKELNSGRSDIYSYIGYERVAANSRPINTESTTIIPLGLNIEKNGEYTFAIPEGTSGIGITLVDEETGIRTSLSALPYTVSLPKGDYNSRFYLEISPIHGTPTDVGEVRGERLEVRGVRKVIIDQNMYIIRDGKMYDARGARVE